MIVHKTSGDIMDGDKVQSERSSEVFKLLESTNTIADNIGERVSVLHRRIECILHPGKESDDEKPKRVSVVHTEFGEGLYDLQKKLIAIDEHLEQLLERCDFT